MATYYVTQAGSGNGSGSSYENSESVANHNGDTFAGDDIIYLCDTITSTLTLPSSGTSGHVITYRGDYAGHAGTVTSAASTGIEAGSKNYITITNLTITGNADYGVYLNACTHITIQNCEISHNTDNGIAIVGASTDNLITLNDIHSNGIGDIVKAGIFMWQAAGTSGHETTISHNDIYTNAAFGIYLYGNYFIVEHNTIYNNGNTGEMTSGIEIFDNTAQLGFAEHNIVRYNKVYGQISGSDDGEGIYVDEGAANNEVYYNLCYNNDGPGFAVYDATYATLYNNTSYGNCVNSSGALTTKTEYKFIATDQNDTTYLIVKNNIGRATRANTYAIYVDAEVEGSTGLDITTNDWYASAANWYYWNDGGGNNLATWNALTGVGTDLNSDPLLISTTDFHPQTTSPCINAGTDVGLTQDFYGNTVPWKGTAVDIGAYEYSEWYYPWNVNWIFVPE